MARTPAAPDAHPPSAATAEADPERDAIVGNELVLLERTHEALAAAQRRVYMDYDQELLSLRDQIAEARAEDQAPLVQQMERLQRIAAQRAEVPTGKVDTGSPYFGHLRLEENERTRDVLIGNATYIDTERGVRIVDWRDAPVSRLYYRYNEGDEYEEEFGGRTLEGTVKARRSVVIAEGVLRRVVAPQGTFVRRGAREGAGAHPPASGRAGAVEFRRLDVSAARLAGGEGAAARPAALEEYAVQRGRLGVRVAGREDRHLPEIPALIDKRQFELISRPGSGLVVIQGGAGSGKTTIGLHRMAYLSFQDARRFSPDKMLVVVFNDALAAYISRVLPGLGVAGVQVITYAGWASRQRRRHLPHTPQEYSEDTPTLVSRLKKHPALLALIDERVAGEVDAATRVLEQRVFGGNGAPARAAWRGLAGYALSSRLTALGQWLRGEREVSGAAAASTMPNDVRLALGATLDRLRVRARDVVWDWAELLTDYAGLRSGLGRLAPGAFTDAELASVVKYCTDRVGEVVTAAAGDEESEGGGQRAGGERRRGGDDRDDEGETGARARGRSGGDDDEEAEAEVRAARPPRRRDDDEDEGGADDDDDDSARYRALDGVDERESIPAALDREDDALLLRLFQRKRGPLRRDRKLPLLYEHIFVDEAQDLSPVELAVLLDCATPARSVTLAGDTAQRLLMENGFTDWQGVLTQLGLGSVAIEPLRIGYRSTREVLELARAVLGPLADPEPPVATRSGAPVEMQRFADAGAAVAFLGDALRSLALHEPRASVAVIAPTPERAQLYYEGLVRAEVPRLSRVRAQDFSFKAGVEVTDIRQVKGLEFDYVVMVDVTAGYYPETDEARHLLHIGATRAAHQLWLVAAGVPSRLLPEALRE